MYILNNQSFFKIQCIFYIIVFFFSFPLQGFAQENLLSQKVTIDYKNTTIKDAFAELENKLSCYFTYESSTIDNQKQITLSLIDISLEKALNKILNDSSLVYKVVDNHVIIRKKYLVQNNHETADSVPKIIVLRGTVTDGTEGQSLPFASISLQGTGTGVIANAEGEFIFKLKPENMNQQICISHLGYKNLCIPVIEMYNSQKKYELERSFIPIQEVIIRKTDARTLIKSAMEKVPENYSLEPVYLTGFYRESVKRRDNFMFFSEAVIQIYKSSYKKTADADMVKVLKARKMENVSINDTVIVKLKSGLHDCLELDIVKNPLGFLNEENFHEYNFDMTDIVTLNDRNAYQIEFEQKEDVKEALFKGKIYIDMEKLAVVGAEFSLNPAYIKKAQNNYIARKKRGVKLRMTSIDYVVNYHLINDKFYINYVRGILKMKVRKRTKLFSTNFETLLELAVNEIDTVDVRRFKRKESENLNTVFFDSVHEYDENFWEQYNFIKPDEPLQEAIKKYGSN